MSNTTQKKPTIAIFTGPEGHLSLALAIKEKLEDRYTVALFEDRDSLFNLYMPFYQYFPAANSIPYSIITSATKRQKIKKMIQTIFHYRYKEKIETFLEEHQPDICISTYFMYNYNLVSLKKVASVPFFNIIPDPRTFNPIAISSDATSNLSFDSKTNKVIKNLEPESKAQETGWFVRNQFEVGIKNSQINTQTTYGTQSPSTRVQSEQEIKEVARKKMGLDTDLFTILITSGSEGTNMVLKLLPALFSEGGNVQVVVACGSNKKLFGLVNSFAKFLVQMKRSATVIPIGFTDKLDEYMRACDIVVGKAGPNTIFESVACKRPFFATTHIAGQEDGNLDLIREYAIGFVEEKPMRAQKLLKSIIKNPSQLDKFAKPLEKLASKNALSGEKLHTIIEAALASRVQ